MSDQVKPERYVIPVDGPFGYWGIDFYLLPDTDQVSCSRCGRVLQWPDASREHARYHAEVENARARAKYEHDQKRWRRFRRWLTRR